MAEKQVPFFSVVMPVYNAGALLAPAIESVLGQSCGDFELLLVDDGSTDGSGALCDGYEARDSRVRVVHQPNGGVVAATNRGLDEAMGTYLYFVDHDDLVLEGALAGLREKLLSLTPKPDMLQCNFVYQRGAVREASGVTLPTGSVPQDKRKRRDFALGALFANQPKMVLSLWSKVLSAEFMRRAGIRGDTRYFAAVDGDITLRIWERTGNIAFWDAPIYAWRVDERATLSRRTSQAVVRARIGWFAHIFRLSFLAGLSRPTRQTMRMFAIGEEARQLDLLRREGKVPGLAWLACAHALRGLFYPGRFPRPWYLSAKGWRGALADARARRSGK